MLRKCPESQCDKIRGAGEMAQEGEADLAEDWSPAPAPSSSQRPVTQLPRTFPLLLASEENGTHMYIPPSVYMHNKR